MQEVGLYDYRNRVYSAELGRFLQTDPMRFSANDVNVYRYVGNDAVNKEDKLGLNSNAGRIEAQADIQERTQPDLNNPIPANAAEAAGGAAQSAMDWLGDYLHEKYLHQAMQDCEKVAHSASGKCKCCIIYLTYKLMGSDLEEIYDGGYGKVKNTPCSEAHPEDSFEAPGENRTTDKYTW